MALESSADKFAPCEVFLLLIGDRLVDFLELGDLRCALVVCFLGELFRDSSEILKPWREGKVVTEMLIFFRIFTHLSATSSTGSRRHKRSSDLMTFDW